MIKDYEIRFFVVFIYREKLFALYMVKYTSKHSKVVRLLSVQAIYATALEATLKFCFSISQSGLIKLLS